MSLGDPPAVNCFLVSGAIASGKSTVARLLGDVTGMQVVSVRQALASMLTIDAEDRNALQVEGAALDRRTQGRWLAEYLIEHLELKGGAIVDSVRTVKQTEPILAQLVGSRLVYLDAHDETRRRRYTESATRDGLKRTVSFDEAMHHPTELEVVRLKALADVVIETDRLSASETVNEILA